MRRKFILALAGIVALSVTGCKVEYAENMTSEEESQTVESENTVRVRYSDERFSSYLQYCEEEYEKLHGDVDIVLELAASEEYVSGINTDSASGGDVPDVYMTVNSDLATLYLAGLAAKNVSDEYGTENYCDTAINACSYGDYLVAYPLAYETSFLLYNTEFLDKSDTASFTALKTYSENADFTSEESASIEAVFKCEVKDLFTNYGFISDGIVTGGSKGDDAAQLSFVNDKVIESVGEYLALIDYFSISTEITYDDCISKFQNGNYLSVIATTNSLSSMEECQMEYGISAYPDYSGDKTTSPLSITTALVVNPYSTYIDKASDFAVFATAGQADKLYGYSGLPSCRDGVTYANANIADIYDSYAKSTPKNKLIYGEQIYPLLEIAMHNIVAGEDAETELNKVDDYMKTQID